MAEDLTFAIYPDAESLPFRVLEKTISNVRRLVTDVDYAVTRERRGRRWIVTDLGRRRPEWVESRGAVSAQEVPTISVKPMLDGSETIEAIASGIAQVVESDTTQPPPHFSADALDDLKRMRGLFTGRERAGRVVFTSNGHATAVSANIAERVERILRNTYSALGSIEGTLEAVNLHGDKTANFTVWDRLAGVPVRCSFPKLPEVVAQVKSMLEGHVLISGKINYFANGTPRSITDVEDMQLVEPPSGLVRASFGSIPDLTGGRTPQEYVRVLRE